MKQVRQRDISYSNKYVESKKKYKLTYMQNRNRLTDIKNKIMVSKEETSKGRLN